MKPNAEPSAVYRLYIKNTSDFALYLCRLQAFQAVAPVISAAVWTIVLVIAWRDRSPAAPLLAVGAVALILLRLYDLRASTLRFVVSRDAELDRVTSLIIPTPNLDIHRIMPSEREERAGFTVGSFAGENVIRSDAFDTALRSGADFPLVVDDSCARRIYDRISHSKETVIPILTAQFLRCLGRQQFHNDPKLCLSSDLIDTESALCHRAGYFDSFATNEIGTRVLWDRTSDTAAINGGSIFPVEFDDDGYPRLRTIADSRANNHIGASTIAITRDNFIVLWEQTPAAMVSSGFLVPTGSGSCGAADARDTLRRTICVAMNRELLEESARRGIELPPQSIRGTLPLGYFRWIARGGKPEFVGVTRLNVHGADLNAMVAEVALAHGPHPQTWPARTKAEMLHSIDSILDRTRRSVLLDAALKTLRTYIIEVDRDRANWLFAA